ncbi:MAG: hypothetical protein RLZZ370_1145 [Bacteroidota bacterium]
MFKKILLGFALSITVSVAHGQKSKPAPATTSNDTVNPSWYASLKFRMIGPAVNSGRVIDLAVNPQNHSEYYVAAACGGVWKTSNRGITFQPIFDQHRIYSIGCLSLDPSNVNTLWVGTGENNNQRSVGYGNGVYRSNDGGKSFQHMGLSKSEHIGRIVVDPRNSNVVYVAAYGPLWNAGGERGVYKSTDGGKTWKNVLNVSEHTGCNEVLMDPRNPDVLYAAFHQRRRHEWTYISGGPESAVYKSTDGGATWNKLGGGMPSGDLGRIALAIAPSNPDMVYAIVEATDNGGVYRSTDRGASWSKMNGFTTAGNYYQELFVDPANAERVYFMDTYLKVSHDGGKTIVNAGEKSKHVDNHALWIDPNDSRHLLVGCDGGLYETFDQCATYDFKQNLPITQFYRATVDNALPFYNIYGGTQDNNTLGGPSRTLNANGIMNSDWFVTVGGDGFKTQVDPNNPNIVYSQWQYGGLVRFDRKTGETTDIKPAEGEGEKAWRWNWDAPLLISNHKPERLYFAANKIFRSDDRGNSWTIISPDLSRQIDRNKLPVMGKVWGMDAVAKNQSTSIFGNIVSFDESPLDANLLIAGTDDGLIHVSNDGGASWSRISNFPGVPDMSYVSNITCSRHQASVVYATFQNHRNGDYKPYVLRSADGGKTWTSISANLPTEGVAWHLAEDHVKPSLLFVGTEFGLHFTVDGGKRWQALKNGLPPAAIKEISIQRRENDLVLATFGRGFAVLDDYSLLRSLDGSISLSAQPATIFPIKDALMYVPATPLGGEGKANQGENLFTAPNPPLGSVIRYYVRDDYKTLKQQRKEKEAALVKAGKPVPYPTADSIRMEDREEAPYLLFTIRDAKGNIVRKLSAPAAKGSGSIVWNFRLPSMNPANTSGASNPDDVIGEGGPMVAPGTYNVTLAVVQRGVSSVLAGPVSFNTVHLNQGTMPVQDREAVLAFSEKVASLQRAVAAGQQFAAAMKDRMKLIQKAIQQSNRTPETQLARLHQMQAQLQQLEEELNGDGSLARREFETLPGIAGRVSSVVYGLFFFTGAPTQTWQDNFTYAGKLHSRWLEKLETLHKELLDVENSLEQDGAPFTPGRFPRWKPE